MSSARTKVLMLVSALHVGGGERFLVGLATGLPADRWDVTVCVMKSHDGPLISELEDAGVRVVSLGRSGRKDVGAFARLVSLLHRERPGIVHTHMFTANLWGTVAARIARVPLVIAHEQTWSYVGQPMRRFFDGRVIGRLADVMVAVSTRDQERMTSIEHVPAAKTTFIPNAYMPPLGDQPAGDLRAELGLDADTPLAGTMVVLRPQKALDVLLDAFAIVSERLPEARLAIAGYGQMAEPWQAHARDIGVAERVHWLGIRTDGAVVREAFDVAVMSSDFEGTPLFSLECMASRTPMVVTDVGGQRDIFENGVSALLVPPQDPPAMAAALEELLRSPQRRQAMAEAAYERLSEFTVELAVGRVEGLYERLLAAKGLPHPRAVAAAAA
jgi:glycosyltransferase involved in cell wall biosynthesis